MEPIVNRVAESGIQVLDLSALSEGFEPVELDLAPFLHMGLVLREKPFRQAIRDLDTAPFDGRDVAITCSADAIVPTWAYMLIAARLDGIARTVAVGSTDALLRDHFERALDAYDWSGHEDRIVVVKGCGNASVPESAFVGAMTRLQRVARKVMYGEPCSSVPLWRRPSS